VPVYDMIEHLMLRHNVKISFPVRFGYRTVYVIATTFVAITLVCDEISRIELSTESCAQTALLHWRTTRKGPQSRGMVALPGWRRILRRRTCLSGA